MIAVLQGVLLLAGTVFFLIGTVGLLRLPDAYCRIHALTKVDNLGLGLIVLGLLPSADGLAQALKLLLIWLVALGASATMGHVVAHAKYHREKPTAGEARPVTEGDG